MSAADPPPAPSPEPASADLQAQEKPAAACAKSMLEIVGGIPKAGSVDEGLNQAADQVAALAPQCKDSVASAGG